MADIILQLTDPSPTITVGIATTVIPTISVGVATAVIPTLSQLTDVDIVGVSDGQLLNYDSTSSKWIASDPEVAVPTPNIDAGTFN